MRERRKEDRVPEEDKVVLSPFGNDAAATAQASIVCLTKDISVGGACLVANASIPVDSRVRIEIALTGSRRLFRGTGTIRWVTGLFEDSVFEMGVEFADIDPDTIGTILEHIYGRPAL